MYLKLNTPIHPQLKKIKIKNKKKERGKKKKKKEEAIMDFSSDMSHF